MFNGNGKTLTISLTIATFIVGLVIGFMGSIVRHDANYVTKEDYREDIRRLEKSIDALSADVKRLLERQ